MPRKRRRSVALKAQRAAVEALHDRLVELYGEPEPGPPLPPLDEVVITILSQNTNDSNRDRAWERLRSRFPDWQSVVDAPVEEVEEALEPGGLHRVKAARIRETLAAVHDRHGGYDLSHLHEVDVAAARRELSSIKGLGAKSVNCILLFSLRKPAFPVDTHVFRVLKRVGAHRCKDLTRTNDELQEAVPDEISYAFHVNLIRHGRQVCHARRPDCAGCGLRDLCAWPDRTGRVAGDGSSSG
jgi:endonuclease-3